MSDCQGLDVKEGIDVPHFYQLSVFTSILVIRHPKKYMVEHHYNFNCHVSNNIEDLFKCLFTICIYLC